MQTTAATPVLFALCILCAGQPDPAFVADHHFWLPGLIYFCVVMGNYALTFWLLTLLRNSGVSEPLHNGLLTSLAYLCVIILMLLAGHSFEAALLSKGLAEQRLMSAAAGMARESFMLFVTTYAVFASRRAYDFICMASAEENHDVKTTCALPGLTTGYGPSHQPTHDLAIIQGMPNLTNIDPCGALEISLVITAIAERQVQFNCVCCAVRFGWCRINMHLLALNRLPYRMHFLPHAGDLPTLHHRYDISADALVRQIAMWPEA